MKKSILIVTSGKSKTTANLDGNTIKVSEAKKLMKEGYSWSSTIDQPYGKESVYIKESA